MPLLSHYSLLRPTSYLQSQYSFYNMPYRNMIARESKTRSSYRPNQLMTVLETSSWTLLFNKAWLLLHYFLYSPADFQLSIRPTRPCTYILFFFIFSSTSSSFFDREKWLALQNRMYSDVLGCTGTTHSVVQYYDGRLKPTERAKLSRLYCTTLPDEGNVTARPRTRVQQPDQIRSSGISLAALAFSQLYFISICAFFPQLTGCNMLSFTSPGY